MKKIIIIIALSAASIAAANTGVITGVVTNDSNGQPIANIWVEAFNYETGYWCGGSEFKQLENRKTQ
jgi:alkyl hydroperoxide reductase subunit AhpF